MQRNNAASLEDDESSEGDKLLTDSDYQAMFYTKMNGMPQESTFFEPDHFQQACLAYSRPQLALQKVLRFTCGAAPVIEVSGLFEANEMFLPLGKPYKQLLSAVLVNASIVARDILREGATAEKPFDYFREAGDGQVRVGFGRVARTVILAMIPPVIAAISYGAGMQSYCQRAENESNPDKMMFCYMLDATLINYLVVGMPAWMLYGISKKLIECCTPLPDKKAKENPQTRFYQNGACYALRGTDSLMQAEMFRLILLLFSPDIMHYSFTPLLPLLLDHLILTPLNYLAYQPRPFRNIVPVGCKPNDTSHHENEVPRAIGRGARSVVWYSCATAASLAIIGFINGMLIDKFAEESDPENMAENKRMAYSAMLLLGGMLLNESIKAAPRLYSPVSQVYSRMRSWCENLSFFNVSRGQAADEMPDMESGLDLNQL